MTLLVLYLLLAIGVSFFCSMAEAILLSVRPSYITVVENRGKRGARVLRRLTENVDRPLAAILTANTIAHTVGAAGVGAQAAVVFGDQYVGLTSAVLTLLILILSEIIPKTLGATYWKQLAVVFGLLIHGLTRLLAPFVWLSEKLTRLLSRGSASAFTFSRDEIRAMADIGAREGVLESKEYKIVANLMKLRQLSVRNIMTPRSVVFSVDETTTVGAFFETHHDAPFSRIPVYGRDREDITGYVLKTDLLIAQARDDFDKPLTAFKREILVVPDIQSASDIYDRLVREKRQIALVVDEYGALQGVVTLEDAVETLVGLEITDEHDAVEDMQELANRRWRERMLAIGIDPEQIKAGKAG